MRSSDLGSILTLWGNRDLGEEASRRSDIDVFKESDGGGGGIRSGSRKKIMQSIHREVAACLPNPVRSKRSSWSRKERAFEKNSTFHSESHTYGILSPRRAYRLNIKMSQIFVGGRYITGQGKGGARNVWGPALTF